MSIEASIYIANDFPNSSGIQFRMLSIVSPTDFYQSHEGAYLLHFYNSSTQTIRIKSSRGLSEKLDTADEYAKDAYYLGMILWHKDASLKNRESVAAFVFSELSSYKNNLDKPVDNSVANNSDGSHRYH